MAASGLGGLLLFMGVVASGCERGWLTSWLASHGVGEGPSDPRPPGSLRLQEVDCPAGLTRCVEGTIQVSKAFRHPEPCRGGSEQCACPWQVIGRCGGGCVAEGVVAAFAMDRARGQLCAVGAGDPPVARPPPLGSPPPVACGEEPYRCVSSSIVACPTGRIVAACLRGCAAEGEGIDDPGIDDSAAVYLLCSR